ncbi:MAG: response regulator [Rhodothermales bacterium]
MLSAFDISPLDSHFQENTHPVFFGDSVVSQKDGAGADVNANTESQEKPQKPDILLVEDNLINQKVALRILAQHGLKADTANNGEEAVEAFKKKHYDLVLMDIQMPVMDGIVATRALRNLKGPNEPYIIAVTANVTEQDKRNCFEAGMNDFVTKPIRSELLAAAIAKAPLAKR